MIKALKTFLIGGVLGCAMQLQAQEIKPQVSFSTFTPVNYGVEFQWYPAGIIPSIESDFMLNERFTLNARVGMNIADRQDFSPHNDHEEGTGFGGSLGVRYYHKPSTYRNFFLGLRADVWDMTIDWTNFGPPKETGSTDITILQPTLEVGYLYQIGNSLWNVGVDAALGFEINVKTEGNEVAQGRVSLLSLHINRGIR